MNIVKLIYGAAALIAVAAAGSAQAHRLNVFAYPQADQVCAEAKFANGAPARGAEVNFKAKSVLRFPPDLRPLR